MALLKKEKGHKKDNETRGGGRGNVAPK